MHIRFQNIRYGGIRKLGIAGNRADIASLVIGI